MSSFKKMFFKKSHPPQKTDEALKKLEATKELLLKKSEFYERKIKEEHTIALQNAKTNKNVALKALKRKKAYENYLQRIDNTLTVIENQIQCIDNAGMNIEVLNVLKSSAATLKGAHKDMKIDDVHDVMDDIAEQRALADEISDAISNTAAFGSEFDDDELMAELENLQAENLKEQLLDVGSIEDLPSVPNKDIIGPSTSKISEDPSEKDLNELLAWAE